MSPDTVVKRWQLVEHGLKHGSTELIYPCQGWKLSESFARPKADWSLSVYGGLFGKEYSHTHQQSKQLAESQRDKGE